MRELLAVLLVVLVMPLLALGAAVVDQLATAAGTDLSPGARGCYSGLAAREADAVVVDHVQHIGRRGLQSGPNASRPAR